MQIIDYKQQICLLGLKVKLYFRKVKKSLEPIY